jgi:hypothetical protein
MRDVELFLSSMKLLGLDIIYQNHGWILAFTTATNDSGDSKQHQGYDDIEIIAKFNSSGDLKKVSIVSHVAYSTEIYDEFRKYLSKNNIILNYD